MRERARKREQKYFSKFLEAMKIRCSKINMFLRVLWPELFQKVEQRNHSKSRI